MSPLPWLPCESGVPGVMGGGCRRRLHPWTSSFPGPAAGRALAPGRGDAGGRLGPSVHSHKMGIQGFKVSKDLGMGGNSQEMSPLDTEDVTLRTKKSRWDRETRSFCALTLASGEIIVINLRRDKLLLLICGWCGSLVGLCQRFQRGLTLFWG